MHNPNIWCAFITVLLSFLLHISIWNCKRWFFRWKSSLNPTSKMAKLWLLDIFGFPSQLTKPTRDSEHDISFSYVHHLWRDLCLQAPHLVCLQLWLSYSIGEEGPVIKKYKSQNGFLLWSSHKFHLKVLSAIFPSIFRKS